jgi:hypothetical protein
MEKLFGNKFIEIWYDQENHWIYSKWQDYQTMESIQSGGAALVQHLKGKACSKILNDNILVKGTWTFAADWTTNVWFPQIVQAGLKQFAWVYSPDIFSRFSSEKAIKNNPGQIVRYFHSLEDGKEWLHAT